MRRKNGLRAQELGELDQVAGARVRAAARRARSGSRSACGRARAGARAGSSAARTRARSRPTPLASVIAASLPDWISRPRSRSRTRQPVAAPAGRSATRPGSGGSRRRGSGRRGRARSSVSSAVISFTVEPTGPLGVGVALARDARRWTPRSRSRSAPAPTAGIRAPARARRGQRERGREHGRCEQAARHWRSLIRWPGLSVCGSRSGFRRRISSSGTPVFSAIDDGVSPVLTRVAPRALALCFLPFFPFGDAAVALRAGLVGRTCRRPNLSGMSSRP